MDLSADSVSVVSSLPSRTVFVLDVSSSMSQNNKLQTLRLSAMRHLEDLREGCYVGIVWFSRKARTQHPVVQITSQSIRQSLINKLPQRVERGTDIGQGLLEGLNALQTTGMGTVGATIILATDGQHFGYDSVYGHNYVAKVLPKLISAQVKVICIALDTSADHNLETLSRATNGNTHVTTPLHSVLTARAMRRAFSSPISEDSPCVPNCDSNSSPFQVMSLLSPIAEPISVCNELIVLNCGLNVFQVPIDPDVGLNTTFCIESDGFENLSLQLMSPSLVSSDMNANHVLKRYQSVVNSAESGVWTLRITSASNETIYANLLVLSESINETPIQLLVRIQEANGLCPTLITAKLFKGNKDIIGAEVTATVDKPDGTQSKVKLIDYNNIYCNYFTDYCGSGRYSVSVLATSDGNMTYMKESYAQSLGLSQKVHAFQRQQIVGSFKVENSMPSKPMTEQKSTESALNKSFNGLNLDSFVEIQRPNFEMTCESHSTPDEFSVIDEMELRQSIAD